MKNKRMLIMVPLLLLLLCLIPLKQNQYFHLIIMRVLISCVMAMGLDICTGVSGQVSLGQAGFMAIGGYSAAKIMQVYTSGFHLTLAFVIAIVITALLSFVIGFFILRLKGDYLSIATMALGEIICLFFETSEFFGKARGLFNITKYNNLYLSFGLFAITLCLGLYFINSKLGFLCHATGQDEIAAKSIGINTVNLKIAAFVLSAVICAVAGVLYSGTLGFIAPGDFDFGRSTDCLAAVILGGPRTIIGPCVAAAIIELTTIFLQPIAEYRMIIYGVLLIYFAGVRYKERKKGKAAA